VRVILAAIALLAAACACVSAQTPAPPPLWRQHTEHLAEDRQLARSCLLEAQRSCDEVIQDACNSDLEYEPAGQRLCDWRAIAAWEDETNAMLEQLRGRLRARDRENLEASQRAWEASMLANVRLFMDHYEGGSLSGQVGAHVRARATSQRARYLADLLLMAGEE
jgi:uncharacterized protein YecT (DUF1311 family)